MFAIDLIDQTRKARVRLGVHRMLADEGGLVRRRGRLKVAIRGAAFEALVLDDILNRARPIALGGELRLIADVLRDR